MQLDGNLTLPNGKKGSIDYFISDHRTDVRMILTEEKQWSYTTASMETASSRNTVEEGLFSTQVNLSRAPKTEVPGWTANTSQYVSKLNNTRPVGPNQLLKVMAGDLLHANVQYYYQQVATNSSGSTVFSSVLSMLGSSITGSAVTSAATKAASTSIIANLNTGLPFSQVISPDITSSTGNLPKAYLNVVFFDERFNFVSESSTSVRVGAANVAANLALTQIKAPENGYCYVYISNESTVSVYFDNLQVRHDRGRIVEENHYYAYGLRINAISSKAYGGPANNYLYQGDFAELDEDLGWTDFMLRSYDAEIGRFLQNDPYDEFASTYSAMGNDPANLVDPTGGCILPEIVVTATVKTTFQVSLSSIVSLATSTFNLANGIISLSFDLQIQNIFNNSEHFSPQSTSDFISEGRRKKFFHKHVMSGQRYPVATRLGRIYEDAVLRSLGVEKNRLNMGGTIPDFVGRANSQYIEFGKLYTKGYVFSNATFLDAKFKSFVPFKDKNNPNQLKLMIDILSAQTGGWEIDSRYGRRWRPDIKASDYGAATLILITPSNSVLDPEIIRYAKSKRVKVIQEYTEFSNYDGSKIRVAGYGRDRTNSNLPVEITRFASSDEVLINWDLK